MFGKKKRKDEKTSLVLKPKSLPVRVDQDAIDQVRQSDGVLSAFFEKKKIERAITIGKLKTDLAKQATEFEKSQQEYTIQQGRGGHIPLILEKEEETHRADLEESKLRTASAKARRSAIENPPPPPKEPPSPTKPDPTTRMLDILRQKCRGLTNTAKDKEKAMKLIEHVSETEAVLVEDHNPELAKEIRRKAKEWMDDLVTNPGEFL
jgi:hypothetical protein